MLIVLEQDGMCETCGTTWFCGIMNWSVPRKEPVFLPLQGDYHTGGGFKDPASKLLKALSSALFSLAGPALPLILAVTLLCHM